MKEFKKLVSAFLVVAMVVTLVTITPSTDANAAVTIYSGKKITLTVATFLLLVLNLAPFCFK